ncbi:hypothetical protein COHA_003661 [Chlorella ohadii]|uniref:PsbP C-terminal domain-containing protein n=1 Tax=Chlorella ohadii TaxID=2649997 RepID=A0AAD5DR50_9CHLO|nr:hypothetical protein COHA_003661 [Chlorella ohadii]
MARRPALAEDFEIFYGLATPPTSYGGYGGKSQNAKEDAKYTFEYPASWKSETINKRDKGTQGVDCRVYNPKNKLQRAFAIAPQQPIQDWFCRSPPPCQAQVYNPKNKLQQAFVITLGRAGEDNRSFRLTDIDSTLAGFAGADYDMLDALTDAVERTDSSREVDGQLYYDVDFASPDVHYLSSITVSSGKVFAMFVKSPARMYTESESDLRRIRSTFKTV